MRRHFAELSGEDKEDVLVAKPISFGIKAPHCCTSHADCKLTIQRRTMTRIIQRVKSGRRKMYERARAAENWGRLGGIVEDCGLRAVGISNRGLQGRRNGCRNAFNQTKGQLLALLSLESREEVGL